MSIKRKNEEELKVASTKLVLKTNGHSTQTWIDSGSPMSIFTIGELKRTFGKQNVQLHPIDPKNDQFRDYRNNTRTLMGNLVAILLSNGWTIQAAINVIGLHTIHHRSGSDAGAGSDVSAGASGARSTQIQGQLEAAMDAILSEFPCELAFTDDLLIISEGSKMSISLKKVDKESMAPKLEKCKLENVTVLMTSGVAEKIEQLTTVSPKRKHPKPPTMQDVKKFIKERLSRSKTRKLNIKAQPRQK